MKFSDLKLGAKLGAAFSAVVILTAGVGTISVLQLARLHAQTDEITDNWLAGVAQSSDIRGAVNASRRAQVDLVLAVSPQQTEVAKKSFEAAAARLDKLMADYDAGLGNASDEEKEIFADMKNLHTSFGASHTKLSELVAGGEALFPVARAWLQGEAANEFGRFLMASSKLTELNNAGAADAGIRSDATYASARFWVVTFVIAAIAMAIVMALWITRLITRPVARAVQAAERIAAGDLTVDLHTTGKDETAVLLQTLGGMKDQLARIVGGVRQNADGVATASAQIASGNNDLSARTEQQASALEETAASMEELSSTVKQNADNARQANQLAMGASTVAVQGGEVVSRVVDTMKGINDSSK